MEEIKKNVSSFRKDITALQRRRSKAISLTLDGTLTKDDVKSELNKIDNKIKTLEIQLYNDKETQSLYEKSKSKFNDLNRDLNKIHNDTSFNIKQELIQKWIKAIKVDYERPYYKITIEYNIPDSEIEAYKMDTKYRWVIDDTGDAVWGKIYLIENS